MGSKVTSSTMSKMYSFNRLVDPDKKSLLLISWLDCRSLIESREGKVLSNRGDSKKFVLLFKVYFKNVNTFVFVDFKFIHKEDPNSFLLSTSTWTKNVNEFSRLYRFLSKVHWHGQLCSNIHRELEPVRRHKHYTTDFYIDTVTIPNILLKIFICKVSNRV